MPTAVCVIVQPSASIMRGRERIPPTRGNQHFGTARLNRMQLTASYLGQIFHRDTSHESVPHETIKEDLSIRCHGRASDGRPISPSVET